NEQNHIRFETLHRRKDGSTYDAEITLQHIHADDRAVFAAVVEDITEKRQNELQIAHMAMHDALTDLPNRILFNERMEHGLERVKRGETFAVLCLDLDRFKTINDTLGHAVGDELLKATSERLLNCVRGTDTVARLGGDEFAVIQIPSGYPEDAANIAKRIGDAVRAPFNIQGRQITIDTSIGIAVAPKDGTDPETLLHKADLAMYRAKADGRGTFHFFEPELDARMQMRQQLEMDLKKGLSNGEFQLHYQPIVNLQTERIAVLEALVRWNHPERGMVPPMDFIPIAEETGLIREIGEWVLRKACADALTWPEEVKVAVNLSSIQFQNQSLALRVTKVLADTGLPASRLELEITESALMQDTEETMVTLHQLRDLGVKISMDDFGSGYSSLGYLSSFPFDKVKIDRSFATDLAANDGAIAIVQAIAGLCSKLGIATTAEGIETTAQLDRVLNLGCTEMQGYLYSPPRPLEEIMDLFFAKAQKATCAA
ncbi:MAG: putative bifunctional diguanylate cyclase/phosphodiesterase, partial [Aestuariivirgaceae bacterium]